MTARRSPAWPRCRCKKHTFKMTMQFCNASRGLPLLLLPGDGEPVESEALHSEAVMPLHMARATAAAGKPQKTAGNKVKAYLPGRGCANYAFLVCLLQARCFRPPSHDACTPGGVTGCPTWLLDLRLLECRLQVCCRPPSASDTVLLYCVWRKMHVAMPCGERGAVLSLPTSTSTVAMLFKSASSNERGLPASGRQGSRVRRR